MNSVRPTSWNCTQQAARTIKYHHQGLQVQRVWQHKTDAENPPAGGLPLQQPSSANHTVQGGCHRAGASTLGCGATVHDYGTDNLLSPIVTCLKMELHQQAGMHSQPHSRAQKRLRQQSALTVTLSLKTQSHQI